MILSSNAGTEAACSLTDSSFCCALTGEIAKGEWSYVEDTSAVARSTKLVYITPSSAAARENEKNYKPALMRTAQARCGPLLVADA